MHAKSEFSKKVSFHVGASKLYSDFTYLGFPPIYAHQNDN